MERNYFLLLSVLLGVSMFAQEKDSLGMKKSYLIQKKIEMLCSMHRPILVLVR